MDPTSPDAELDDAAWEARRDRAVMEMNDRYDLLEHRQEEHVQNIEPDEDVVDALRSPGDVSQITGGDA